jgi:hypothetical protein
MNSTNKVSNSTIHNLSVLIEESNSWLACVEFTPVMQMVVELVDSGVVVMADILIGILEDLYKAAVSTTISNIFTTQTVHTYMHTIHITN